MEKNLKRTFIPPQNRPTIRSAELRSARESQHYLAIFNHQARRYAFCHKLLQSCLPMKKVDSLASDDQLSISTLELFDMEEHKLIELFRDLNITP